MKSIIYFFLFPLLLISCKTQKNERPDNALDTGRDFIRASLNGDFKSSRPLVFEDSTNIQLFESYIDFYKKLPKDKKENYKNASYEINKLLEVDDSTTIINYSNSFMNKPMDIKLVKKNKIWWVDFKYTYSGNLPID